VQAISFATAPLRLHLAALALVGACVWVGVAGLRGRRGCRCGRLLPRLRLAPASGPALQPSTTLQPLPRGEAARQLPIVLQAQKISGQPDLLTQSRR
jgi:hypothetical protein